jgi:UDP-sulfoquinovose synthase
VNVLIAGIDGYLGWTLAQYLAGRGHRIGGIDNFLRRRWVEELNSWSAIPIASIEGRLRAFEHRFGTPPAFWDADLCNHRMVRDICRQFKPDAIVHLGECPSAPYSMIDVEHALFTQTNNISSTFSLLFAMRDFCPDAHLVKLGTMGEYGTPNVPIPEGFFEIEYRGRKDRLPFPRQARSWYHLSKVHDSHNVMFACDVWKLRSTDIMQGVVFGTRLDETRFAADLATRLDFDEAFGTAINRFCCQVLIGHPLTIYGGGGQVRAFLPLRDSMQCLGLAIEHPASRGEYRVFNQFESAHGIGHVAALVHRAAQETGRFATLSHIANPRMEREDHFYAPDRNNLVALGYVPTGDTLGEIKTMLDDLSLHVARIEEKKVALLPSVHWSCRPIPR